MVDPQRDVIDDSKFSKALGQAAQFNGRQSNLPVRIVGGILFIVGST
jgi:hypothetical protein